MEQVTVHSLSLFKYISIVVHRYRELDDSGAAAK